VSNDQRNISCCKRDLNDSRRVQLEILQVRVNLHGSRMWQLPLTYLATIAGAVSFISKNSEIVPINDLFYYLCVLGLVFLFCFVGAYEGYTRTIKNMNAVERSLRIGDFSRSPYSHSLPYLSLLLLGIIFCGFQYIKLSK